jgi:flagellar transcriptional activator FlhC
MDTAPRSGSVLAYVDRRAKTLLRAKELVLLGARLSTVELVTGLGKYESLRMFFDRAENPPKAGRHCESTEWPFKVTLVYRCDAAIVVAGYRNCRDLRLDCAESLIQAYKNYAARFDDGEAASKPKPRIDFERAFDLVRHVEGIWGVDHPDLCLVTCSECRKRYLSGPVAVLRRVASCPFCSLRDRYERDGRVRAYYPPRQSMPLVGSLYLGLLLGIGERVGTQ